MSKAKFSELVKAMRNEEPIVVKTNNYKWFLCWESINNKFQGTIERKSKNGKQLNSIYDNSIGFFDKVMRIAEIKNLQLTDRKSFYEPVLK